jgi:hypothetical protein
MVRLSLSILTKKNSIADLSRRAQAKVKSVIAADAQVTKADAQARSRVDTGAMKAGWTAFNTSPYEYELANSVPHTIFNEYGTYKMSAQPMATPAVEAAAVRLPKAIGEAFNP